MTHRCRCCGASVTRKTASFIGSIANAPGVFFYCENCWPSIVRPEAKMRYKLITRTMENGMRNIDKTAEDFAAEVELAVQAPGWRLHGGPIVAYSNDQQMLLLAQAVIIEV
jgi:hypothetical protein